MLQFCEEYVHGAGSNKQQTEIPKQSVNKKTKFVYSDISEDLDDGEDEGGRDDRSDDNIRKSMEEKDEPTDRATDANCETLVNGKVGPQKESSLSFQEEIQEDEDSKQELTKKHEIQEAEAVEQPILKKCIEIILSKSPNLTSSMIEEKPVDKSIEAELVKLGDKSMVSGNHC
ncbi:hypothetical protein ACH5RR_003017 [Cinchona calisaya]|uniref:Uncharacterized protein n=1 Tax=Cinchona calisaya TaxID=153742 RepID=A0ABD3ATM2_9GENT